jgi:hypothetical protein
VAGCGRWRGRAPTNAISTAPHRTRTPCTPTQDTVGCAGGRGVGVERAGVCAVWQDKLRQDKGMMIKIFRVHTHSQQANSSLALKAFAENDVDGVLRSPLPCCSCLLDNAL